MTISTRLAADLTDTIGRLEWQKDAACTGYDPELWFTTNPVGSGSLQKETEQRERQQQAKAICGRCVVRDECLDAAIERRERYGIWGGVMPTELAEIIKARRGLRLVRTDVPR